MASVGNARALENEAIQWQKIHQLCGSIVSVVPIKKAILRPNWKSGTLLYSNAMKGARVTLYRAESQSAVCCGVAAKMAEIVAGRYGVFRFADYVGGYYWLVVQFGDGEARVPIKVDTYDKHACEVPMCSGLFSLTGALNPESRFVLSKCRNAKTSRKF